jgi:hypothetical protein
MAFIVIYDACVLYPAPLRDLLMHLAMADLFQAKWTDQIHEEWIRSNYSALKRCVRHKRSVLSRSFVKIENKKAEHTPVCEHFLFLIFAEIRPKMDVFILWLNSYDSECVNF